VLIRLVLKDLSLNYQSDTAGGKKSIFFSKIKREFLIKKTNGKEWKEFLEINHNSF